jgi:hypothetical protein
LSDGVAQALDLSLGGFRMGFDFLSAGCAVIGRRAHLCAVGANEVTGNPEAFGGLSVGSVSLRILGDEASLILWQSDAGLRIGVARNRDSRNRLCAGGLGRHFGGAHGGRSGKYHSENQGQCRVT